MTGNLPDPTLPSCYERTPIVPKVELIAAACPEATRQGGGTARDPAMGDFAAVIERRELRRDPLGGLLVEAVRSSGSTSSG